jgi:hypothetical protein
MTEDSIARVKVALAARRRLIEAEELAVRLRDELVEDELQLFDLAVECGGGTAKPRLGRPPGSRNKAKPAEAQG